MQQLLTTHYSLLTNKGGYTLLEVLFTIGIMVILLVLGLNAFSSYQKNQTLDTSVGRIDSLLQEARSQTMSALDSSVYGVHFEASQATLFKGDTYSSSDPDNKGIAINTLVTISDISLNGGGSDVIFNRITGDTDEYGTIKIELVSDSSKFEIITISPTGVFSDD